MLTLNFINKELDQEEIHYSLTKREVETLEKEFLQELKYFLDNEGVDYNKEDLKEEKIFYSPDWMTGGMYDLHLHIEVGEEDWVCHYPLKIITINKGGNRIRRTVW